ncbi:MAG: protein kinase domain-containing protein, partial [Phycisphaerales bacterium]
MNARPEEPEETEWFKREETLLAMARRARADGFHLPGYEGLRELGRGGQGVVYAATQVSTRRPVAIKVLHGGAAVSARQLQRFRREAELVARLNHPHIVKVFDSGVTPEGCAFLV